MVIRNKRQDTPKEYQMISISQLAEYEMEEDRKFDLQLKEELEKMGIVMFVNMTNVTIEMEGPDFWYEIDLETCVNSSEILDWVYQIYSKNWCTPLVLAGIIHLFQRASEKFLGDGIQSKFCGSGMNRTQKWPECKVTKK